VKHNQKVDFDSSAGQLIQGADKSLALPRRKLSQCFCQNGVNFLLRLALQRKKKLDDSSRLDVVEIARVPNMLLSLFPFWSG